MLINAGELDEEAVLPKLYSLHSLYTIINPGPQSFPLPSSIDIFQKTFSETLFPGIPPVLYSKRKAYQYSKREVTRCLVNNKGVSKWLSLTLKSSSFPGDNINHQIQIYIMEKLLRRWLRSPPLAWQYNKENYGLRVLILWLIKY